MKLTCAKCAAPIHGTDIDLTAGCARCPQCGSVTSLPSTQSNLAAQAEHVGDGWQLVVTPHRSLGGLKGIVILFPLIFMGAGFAGLLHSGSLFALPHLIAGAVGAYLLLGMKFNRIRLRVCDRQLRVIQLPFPLALPRHLELASITGFRHENRTTPTMTVNGSSIGTGFQVTALTKDGRSIPLGFALPDENQARDLAGRLNAARTAIESAPTRTPV